MWETLSGLFGLVALGGVFWFLLRSLRRAQRGGRGYGADSAATSGLWVAGAGSEYLGDHVCGDAGGGCDGGGGVDGGGGDGGA